MRHLKTFILLLYIPIISLSQSDKEFEKNTHYIGFNYYVQFSYRQNFKNLYGTLHHFGISYSIIISHKSELEFSGYFNSKKSILFEDTRYRSIPIFIRYKHFIETQKYVTLYLSAGPALYFAEIETKIPTTRNLFHYNTSSEFKQTDRGLGFIIGLGVYFNFKIILLSMEYNYIHTFIGDPDIGRLGNVGGFNILISLKTHL